MNFIGRSESACLRAVDKRRNLLKLLSPCRLCPRECGVDRLSGEKGFCGMGFLPRIAALSVHHGEEPPISGTLGSGNIFFSGCNLRCLYCQNYPVSQMGVGRDMTIDELAGTMLEMEKKGAHNINLVTPAHFVPQIAVALDLALEKGLDLPIVYNTNGYEKPETLSYLRGLIDIYLPDMKYGSETAAKRLSGASDYVLWNLRALAAMFGQVGNLKISRRGLAVRGLIVRHLVLPGDVAGTEKVLTLLAGSLGTGLHISLMFQYFPAYLVIKDPILGRCLTDDECERALQWIEEAGFKKGWMQSPPDKISQDPVFSSPQEHNYSDCYVVTPSCSSVPHLSSGCI